MQRGSLIIYDNKGKIFSNTGDAEGDILPNEVPNGLPYIETQFGELNNKRILGIDISVTPHKLITEDIIIQPTYDELQQQLLQAQGVI